MEKEKELKPCPLKGGRVGSMVVYKQTDDKYEHGHITSWNDEYVFVCYQNDFQSKATHPSRLTLIESKHK